MQVFERDLGYWMGWTLAALMAGGLLLYVGANAVFQEGVCTGIEGEQCLREWISALGGWITTLVTAPTVLYLARQIRQSGSHHRQILAVEVRKNLLLALKTARSARSLIHSMNLVEYEWSEDGSGLILSTDPQEQFHDILDFIHNSVNEETYNRAEDVLGVPSKRSRTDVINHVNFVKRLYGDRKANFDFAKASKYVRQGARMAGEYGIEMQAIAQVYTRQITAMIHGD